MVDQFAQKYRSGGIAAAQRIDDSRQPGQMELVKQHAVGQPGAGGAVGDGEAFQRKMFEHPAGGGRNLPVAGERDQLLPVDFQVEVCGRCRKLCVASAVLDESTPKDLSNAPSLILRCVGRQESAWEVAKRYNTTIADILAANQLEQESEIPCERLLLIPKKRA